MDLSQIDPNLYDPAALQAAQESAWIAGVFGTVFSLWLMGLMICSMMGVFIKAGKPWWAALIPIYNMVVMLEIVGRPVWWVLLMFIPLANLVVMFIVVHDLSKAFGKDISYTLGMIFLGIVFYPMLAFGSARYQGAPN
jgi:hypothetical protein